MTRVMAVHPGLIAFQVALLVQFAPLIHSLGPHPHGFSSCQHSPVRVHFEASLDGGAEAPCPVCTNLLNRHVVSVSIAFRHEIALAAPSGMPAFEAPTVSPSLQHPDGRGPPALL